MADITVYTFEDLNGPDVSGWSTQDYNEAKRYAQNHNLRIIANEYTYLDSEPLEDYRTTPNALSEEEIDAIEWRSGSESVDAFVDGVFGNKNFNGGVEVLASQCADYHAGKQCEYCYEPLGGFHKATCFLLTGEFYP